MDKISVEKKSLGVSSLQEINEVKNFVNEIGYSIIALVKKANPRFPPFDSSSIVGYVLKESTESIPDVKLKTPLSLSRVDSTLEFHLKIALADTTSNVLKLLRKLVYYLRYVSLKAHAAGIPLDFCASIISSAKANATPRGEDKLDILGLFEESSLKDMVCATLDVCVRISRLTTETDSYKVGRKEFKQEVDLEIVKMMQAGKGSWLSLNATPYSNATAKRAASLVYGSSSVSGGAWVEYVIPPFDVTASNKQEQISRVISDVRQNVMEMKFFPTTSLFYLHKAKDIIKTIYRMLPYEHTGAFILDL